MHLKDDLLRAYLDHELPDQPSADMKAHLAGCEDCAARLEAIRARAVRTETRLNWLAPGPVVTSRSQRRVYQSIQDRQKEVRIPMFKKRSFLGALSVFIVLVLVFTITPASAWASSFLGLFRVQKITVISFSPQALQKSTSTLNSQRDVIQQVFKNDLVIHDNGKAQKVNSTAQAAQLAGFTPRLLDQQGQIYFKPGLQADLTIDQPKFQALMDAAGLNAQLPAAVNGKVVSVNVPDAIVAGYGNCPDTTDPTDVSESQLNACTLLMELPSPTVNAPNELNVNQLGQAMFEFLGMPADQAASLSNNIDWASTLVLPIPQGEGYTYQNLPIDGVSGTLVESTGNPSNRYAVIWTKDGMVYTLTGPGGKAEAMRALSTFH